MRMPEYFKRHTYTPNEFYDYMEQIERGLAGELQLVLSPATTGSLDADIADAITADSKFIRTVKAELKSAADGMLHTWFTGSFAAAVAAAAAGDGAVALADEATAVSLKNGVGTIAIEYTGTWAAGDTCTLTITGGNVLGYTVANKTSVDTIVTEEAGE